MSKEQILEQFKVFSMGTDGIGGWLGADTDNRVFDRLGRVDREPLAKVQLNQLFAFGHEAPISDDFFRYYWLSQPPRHPYDVATLPDFDPRWLEANIILSLAHLTMRHSMRPLSSCPSAALSVGSKLRIFNAFKR